MSYDPSHRKPRHAGRMPQVITPEEAWPAVEGGAYADGGGYRGGGQGGADAQGVYWSAAYQNPSQRDAYPAFTESGYRGAASGYGGTTGAYPGTTGAYPGTTGAYPGTAEHNTGGWNGWTTDGYGGGDGFDGARDGFGGSASYQDYGDYPGYAGPASPENPALTAPDAGLDQGTWQAGRGEPPRRGLIVGAVTGFLAAGMAIGVATLAAAFVRPQASPIIAVGEAFIDRTPPALKNFAVQRFGENDKTMLLLGMYVTIALIAMGIGVLARRTATLGVAGIAAFGLFGAFVAITRPESRASDVIPSVIGGIAGVAALLWLQRASAPATPPRPTSRTAPRTGPRTGPRTALHGRRAR